MNVVRNKSGYAWLAQRPPTWWLRLDTKMWHAYCGVKTWGGVSVTRCGRTPAVDQHGAMIGEVGPYTEPVYDERVCKRCRYLVATDALVRGSET